MDMDIDIDIDIDIGIGIGVGIGIGLGTDQHTLSCGGEESGRLILWDSNGIFCWWLEVH